LPMNSRTQLVLFACDELAFTAYDHQCEPQVFFLSISS